MQATIISHQYEGRVRWYTIRVHDPNERIIRKRFNNFKEFDTLLRQRFTSKAKDFLPLPLSGIFGLRSKMGCKKFHQRRENALQAYLDCLITSTGEVKRAFRNFLSSNVPSPAPLLTLDDSSTSSNVPLPTATLITLDDSSTLSNVPLPTATLLALDDSSTGPASAKHDENVTMLGFVHFIVTNMAGREFGTFCLDRSDSVFDLQCAIARAGGPMELHQLLVLGTHRLNKLDMQLSEIDAVASAGCAVSGTGTAQCPWRLTLIAQKGLSPAASMVFEALGRGKQHIYKFGMGS